MAEKACKTAEGFSRSASRTAKDSGHTLQRSMEGDVGIIVSSQARKRSGLYTGHTVNTVARRRSATV